MKTLSDHTLIYDNDCPLCVGYTNAFLKIKMLDKNGRKAFGKLTEMDKDASVTMPLAAFQILTKPIDGCTSYLRP